MRYAGISADTKLYGLPIAALDFETTGLAAQRGDRVCEVGIVSAEGESTEILLSSFVNPGRPLSERTRELTGIDERELRDAPDVASLVPQILRCIGGRAIVMHNAPFDAHFLLDAVKEAGLAMPENLVVDTLLMARFLDRNREGNSLRQTAERYGIRRGRSHRAADDALATARAFHALVPYLELRGMKTVGDLVEGRMAGALDWFSDQPSSMLLDLVSRATALEQPIEILYASELGRPPLPHRVRVLRLEEDRYLIGWNLDVEAERTYRLDRILALAAADSVYLGPWIVYEELPPAFQR
jgi:DNA polymerase III epsilon subunit-like protein